MKLVTLYNSNGKKATIDIELDDGGVTEKNLRDLGFSEENNPKAEADKKAAEAKAKAKAKADKKIAEEGSDKK